MNQPDDINLLYENPKELIEKWQYILEIVVSKKIKNGFIRYEEKDDYIQDINVALIKNIPSIQKNYNHSFQLKTYFSAIVNNTCFRIIKDKKKKNEVEVNTIKENKEPSSELVMKDLVLSQELNRLRMYLDLYHNKKNKILLCLKLIYRIPFDYNDFSAYSFKINKFMYNKINKKLQSLQSMTNNDIYLVLSQLCSQVEKKKYTSEAIRKWINSKVDELIYLMNGSKSDSNYTKETFQYLMEYYYSYNTKLEIQPINDKVNVSR